MSATAAQELTERLSRSPFMGWMGLTVTGLDTEAGWLRIALPARPEFERQAASGQIHGGVIAALIDIAADYALIARLGYGVPTVNFSTDFLRPARNAGLVAEARIRRSGRSLGVVDVDVTDADGALIAVGRGCYSTRQPKT